MIASSAARSSHPAKDWRAIRSFTKFLIMKKLQHHPTLQYLKQDSSCLKWIADCYVSISTFQVSVTETTEAGVQSLHKLHRGPQELFGVNECSALSEIGTVSKSSGDKSY
jgi:hypothetical protein